MTFIRFSRHRGAMLTAALFALGLAGAPLVRAETTPPSAAATIQLPSFAPIVKRVLPAVVNISVTEKASPSDFNMEEDNAGPDQNPFQGFPPSPFDEFLRRFFQQQERGGASPIPEGKRIALGSGFIIDPAGYIVTNNHVVENADSVTVIFQDNSRHPAKVIGRDPKTDLALVKIESKKPLPYVTWGDSGASEIGDWVLAVGNPFGLGGTVSPGVISARGRDIHAGPYDDFLQIDASINRGNSGGPDFNLNGQVIGINTAIYSPNGGSVGIGFAIPSSLAKPVIEQLREHGKVERGWLGVQIQSVTSDIAKNLGLPHQGGALIADVNKGSPAEKAGFKQGDVILEYDGHDIAKLRDLPIAVAETPVGHVAQVKVWRKGAEVTLSPKIAEMPANQSQLAETESAHTSPTMSMGLKLSALTPELRRRAQVPKNVRGVLVTDVSPDSPLAQVGVEAGDVIVSINQQPVTTPKQAAEKLAAVRAEKGGNKTLLLLINRQGINQYVAMSVQTGKG
jgi:serine protease Do